MKGAFVVNVGFLAQQAALVLLRRSFHQLLLAVMLRSLPLSIPLLITSSILYCDLIARVLADEIATFSFFVSTIIWQRR